MNHFALSLTITALIAGSDAAACYELSDESDCLLQASCAWQDDPEEGDTNCFCDSQIPLDVLFIMDQSGSIGKDEWPLEKQFVIDMIQNDLAPGSNVHVASFSDVITPVWNFTMDQSNHWAQAIQAIDAAEKSGKYTHMADALRYVQSVFNHQWTGTNERLLVFLTDGEPKNAQGTNEQEPCPEVAGLQTVMGEENIVVVLIAENADSDDIKCMVTPGYDHDYDSQIEPDEDRILRVDDWNEDDFARALAQLFPFLCPAPFDIKVTEVSIERFSNGHDSYHSRFVEFYNPGDELDFSEGLTNFRFDGFLTADAFGQQGAEGCSIVIAEKQYMVIYDPDADHAPECLDCNCTLDDSTMQCGESLYIPCDSDATTSGCGACIWSDTMDNDKWFQKAFDKANDELLSAVVRNDSNGWTVEVFTGYTTELIAKTAQTSIASNWDMSCTERGTPGADPLSPCTHECIPDVCVSQGDSKAICSEEHDLCDCTEDEHFYASPTEGCAYLPPPRDCHVEPVFCSENPELVGYSNIYWSKDGHLESGVFFEVSDSTETTTTTGYSDHREYVIAGDAVVTVRAVFDDPVSGRVYSEHVSCSVTTLSPTAEPTSMPTECSQEGYVYSPDAGCVYLPPPLNCYYENRGGMDETFSASIYWDTDGEYEEHVIFQVFDHVQTTGTFDDGTTMHDGKHVVYRTYQIPSTAAVRVRAVARQEGTGDVFGELADCELRTGSPTTLEPTTLPSQSGTPAPQPKASDPPSETEDPTPAPSRSPTEEPSPAPSFVGQCKANGFLSANGQACCPIDICSSNGCGGAGCSMAGNGPNAYAMCCVSGILESERLCDEVDEAPCVFYSTDPTCENGRINGNEEVCCPTGLCEQCGGTGCSDQIGGNDYCCASGIIFSAVSCDDSAAPCILPAHYATLQGSSNPLSFWFSSVYTGIAEGEWSLWQMTIVTALLLLALSGAVLCCAICFRPKQPKYAKVQFDSTTDDEAVDLVM